MTPADPEPRHLALANTISRLLDDRWPLTEQIINAIEASGLVWPPAASPDANGAGLREVLERLDRGVTRATDNHGKVEARTVHMFIADLLAASPQSPSPESPYVGSMTETEKAGHSASPESLDVERLARAMDEAFTVTHQETFVDDAEFWRGFAPRVATEYERLGR